jgi:hypothetical protein
MSRLRLGTRRALALGIVLVLLTTGTALALVILPDSNGVIHACYKPTDGSLRLVSSEADCKKAERPLSWNQQGPKGDPGELSLAGQVCPPGEFVSGFDTDAKIICNAPPITCPVNASDDVYVDADADPAAVVEATGVNKPAACRFPTITAAISNLNSRSVTGGRIILSGATGDPASFTDESFPLVMPEGTLLTTADDGELGGAGPNPANYLIDLTGPTVGIELHGGGLRGITIQDTSGSQADAMVDCAAGEALLDSVELQGGGGVLTGIRLNSGCKLTAWPVGVKEFAGDGIVIGAGATLTTADGCVSAEGLCLKIHSNDGNGVVVHGNLDLRDSIVAFNGEQGILIAVEDASEPILRSNNILYNAAAGLRVEACAQPIAYAGPNLPAAAVGIPDAYFDEWCPMSIWKNDIHSNGWPAYDVEQVAPQVFLTGERLYSLNGMDNPDGATCFDNRYVNRIYSYKRSALGIFSGLYAANGAVVDASINTWGVGGPADGVRVDASGSMVIWDPYCGVISTIDPIPGEPWF